MTSVPAHFITIDAGNAIHVIHQRPMEGKHTFVFLNSMGANTDVWEQTIAPNLRSQGYGTMSFDYRGQGETRFDANATLEPDEIIADIVRVFEHEKPVRAIMCGLSIGGLFAARAWHKGANAEAVAFVNTLRKPSAQVEWINTLEARLIAMGGMPLVHDVLRPVLSSCDQLELLRSTHLPVEGYTPWPKEHPRRRLAEGVNKADWGFPWCDLTIPALVFTGLHDRLFRIQDDVDEILEQIPNKQVIEYQDGGHSIHAEFPDRFVADLVTFSKGIEGA